jgi:uncharacterized membrane protein
MDMPMLNRQEIAFLFFNALLLLLTDSTTRYRLRVILFALFGAGVVFSHYSTTYALLLIFMAACFIRYVFERPGMHRFAAWFFRILRRPTPGFIGREVRHRLVIVPMVVGLATVAFLWNVQITHTSGGLVGTLVNAAKSIGGNLQKDRSSDTRVSLFGGRAPDPAEILADYKAEQEQARTAADPAALYPAGSYNAAAVQVSPDAPQPLTPLGKAVSATGLDVYALNYWARQSFAKVLQVLVLIGLWLLFFSKRLKLHPSAEYIAASMSSLLFLTILLFVPVLSIEYGLLRAFQQVLIVLALPVAIGSLVVATFVTKRHPIGLTFVIAILFFLTSTGVFAELTGGYVAPLHLRNAGIYYDSYYIRQGEKNAIEWVAGVRGGVLVQGDRIAANRIELFGHFTPDKDLYPGLVRRDAFVYLGAANIQKGKGFASYEGEDVQYTYPLRFLEDNKDLLYSNQQARIYK